MPCSEDAAAVSASKRARAEDGASLRFVRLSEHATAPTRGSARAAGYDLFSAYDYTISPMEKAIVKTDIQIAVPSGCYGRVAPRSGLAVKHFIDVGAGVIDEDYRGNVGVVLFNFGKDASDDLDDLNFFNQKKKKKKTKKIFDIDEAEEAIKDVKIESDAQEPAEPEDDLDIMLGNKKKKKKNVKFPEEDEILEKDEALEDEDSKKDDGISFSSQTAWAGSERDYTYEELLNRVFNIMREKNPDMVAED